jgi:V8-like Glu-specific endopeptidase
MILDDRQKPVRSEDSTAREAARERPRIRPTTTRMETVPGYRAMGLASRPASGGPLRFGDGRLALRGDAAPVSAAVASFGTVAHPEIVIGDDDRTPIPDPTLAPWCHICALRIRSSSGTEYVGTGWLSGPSTVMTAGHCVYLHDDGGWPASIRVIPALNGTVEPVGDVTSSVFRATDGWVQDRDTGCDYGAIQLAGSGMGTQAGWFDVGAANDDKLAAAIANISGYPYDLDRATRQYFHARKIMSVGARRLFYDIDTFGGQSGSPIFINDDGRRIVVGVHTTGSGTSNSGTRITPDVLQNIVAWSAEAAARPADAHVHA